VRFLIVDDDHTCRELLKGILAPYAHCDLAFDGNEAVEAVRLALEEGSPYDLICLDIMMPGADGHEALERIRELEKRHGICGLDGVKIIMVTALHDSKHCIRSFREGCEAYCTKPFEQETLLNYVGELVGELPQPPGGKSEPSAHSPELAEQPAEKPGGGRFLIVDDDEVSRELIQTIISPYGQCSVAYDGQEAIDAVRLALEENDPYDLVCLDIMMPGVDGHEALKEIRKLEARHGIHGLDGVKVIMITALRDSKHCIQCFREGCECYLTKPIEEEKLLAKLRELGLLEVASL
jgi:two-component system chemotaxis response regulator CheY